VRQAWLIALVSCLPLAAHAQTRTGGAPLASASASEASYAEGQELFIRGRYFDAMKIFRRLVSDTGSPNARLYLARCLKETGELPEAVRQMTRTLRDATALAAKEERYVATRDAASRELADLEGRIGRVALFFAGKPAGLKVRVAGDVVPAAALSEAQPVTVGVVTVKASAPGFRPYSEDFEVAAGETVSVAVALLALPKKPKPKSPRRVGRATSAAHGAAGAARRAR
jgi:hypothetical protein